MPNAIFRKLTALNAAGKKQVKDDSKLCYRIVVNGRYVTDYKVYDKEKAEAEAAELGGTVDRTRLSQWQLKPLGL